MINGIGTDIVEIERFKVALEKHPRMVDRLFTLIEQEYCSRRKRPYLHYAVRFAAKEAVLKSVQTGRSRGIGWKDVEVLRTEEGSPQTKLYNNALSISKSKNIKEIKISLSFSHHSAIAMAIAIKC